VGVMDDGWTDLVGLIELASEHGHAVTARSLEDWRYKGLLPRPVRQPKGRAVWLYPPGTGRQLLRLLHWLARADMLHAVRIALWVEGFEIDLGGVRDSLRSLLDREAAAAKREPWPSDDLSTAIDLMAGSAARMRGRAPFPRVVRMTQKDRTRACAYALALMSGDQQEVERRSEDARLFERMLGLRSGHAEGLAAELSPLNGMNIGHLQKLMSVEHIGEVIDTASVEEYEIVRLIGRAMLLWLPMLVPVMRQLAGQKGAPLADAALEMFGDPAAEAYVVSTVGMLVSVHAKAHAGEEIRSLLAGTTPRAIDSELFSLIPVEMRDILFRQLPAHQQEHLKDELARSRAEPR
jgi:hypothetical protein